jgi:hypothetical protein
MRFRILLVSLCSELRFRRAYTRWKAYEILHKIMEKSWDFDRFLSVWFLKLHRRYQRFIVSPTSLPFGILAITLCSELRFGRSCTCWKAYEMCYKILRKFWAFEHFLIVGWTDGSVGSSGASHFCANTSLYVFPKKHRMNRRNYPMVPPDHLVLIHLFFSSQEFIRFSQKMGPSDHPMPYFQHILIWA